MATRQQLTRIAQLKQGKRYSNANLHGILVCVETLEAEGREVTGASVSALTGMSASACTTNMRELEDAGVLVSVEFGGRKFFATANVDGIKRLEAAVAEYEAKSRKPTSEDRAIEVILSSPDAMERLAAAIAQRAQV